MSLSHDWPETLEAALAYADRRERLIRTAPKCEACGSEQVQLIAYINTPATWKCRKCRMRFVKEPSK